MRIVGGVVAGVVALVALLWVFQRELIYLPGPGPVPAASSVAPGARDVELLTGDGLRLGGWLVPPQDGDRGVAVLVTHGNGGDRSRLAPLARALAARGLTVLLFDYRGYGGNPGSPTESGLALDARAAQRYLAEEVGIPAHRQVYLGESLGSAVATGLATEVPPGALVLRSPFVDLAAAGERSYPFLPVRLLLKDRYPLAEQVARVRAPVTVVYGTADRTVPPEQSLAVAGRAGPTARVVTVEGADHNDPVLVDGDAVVDAVVAAAETAARTR
jgi:hypothetical protein